MKPLDLASIRKYTGERSNVTDHKTARQGSTAYRLVAAR